METPTISSNGQKLSSFLDEKMYDGSFTNDDFAFYDYPNEMRFTGLVRVGVKF